MRRIFLMAMALILALTLCACNSGGNHDESSAQSELTQEQDGRGDIIDDQVPDGADDVIMQGVFYYELAEISGDYGDGLSPREGAGLVSDLLTDMGLYSNNGIPAGKCVYISLDELAALDSAMGRECYIYSVGLGTPEGGFAGDGYQVIYRVSVDYSGEKSAAVYEDFSNEYDGDGRGGLIPDETPGFTLVADFSDGSPEENTRIREIPLPPMGETPPSNSLVAFYLADSLSEWTGLDFALNDVSLGEDSITVDWSADSTLIAGLDDREQKEDFHFFDAVSLNWFMMDSLAQTLKRNLDVATVYYCSNGKPVTFTNPEDMAAQGLPELPVDQPYEGSAFFVAHSGAKG